MHDPTSVLENETYNFPWDFDIQMDHLISARRTDLIIINNKKRRKKRKKRTCRIVDFAVPANHSYNWKRLKRKISISILIGNWKKTQKLWNMKVTLISIVNGALGTITKRLIKWLEDLEIRGRVQTTKTNVLLRSDRILRRILETWRDLLSLKLQWKTISVSWYEQLLRSK